jgi:hypothetical protein
MRTEFVVPEHLVGVMIGKKGARVTEIIKQSGVKNISVDGGNGESEPSMRCLFCQRILVPYYAVLNFALSLHNYLVCFNIPCLGRVTIVGTDAQSVERAREMFEVFEENMEIAREDMEQMLKDYSLLSE